MNFAIIFAGGTGSRMNSSIPKQFLLINKKPILVYTIEKFQNSAIIDKIVISCLDSYISKVFELVKKYKLTKVIDVIPGGKSAFESQKKAIKYIINHSPSNNDIVFIHDGVRPFINDNLLINCLQETKIRGSAITVSPASETIATVGTNSEIVHTTPRQSCVLARAPQVFYIKDIYEAHLKAEKNDKEYIDSASMMIDQGKKLGIVYGPVDNIKITTQFDYQIATLLIKDKK